jgi:hypothetical protein
MVFAGVLSPHTNSTALIIQVYSSGSVLYATTAMFTKQVREPSFS